MLPSPSPVAAILLGLGIVAMSVAVPSSTAFPVLGGVVVMLCLNSGYRVRVPLLLKVLLPFALLMSLVAVGRIVGGFDASQVADEYLVRFQFVVAVVVATTLFTVSIEPLHVLAVGDSLGFPRSLTYVLVSLYSLSSSVRELGSRQLALLDLKGVDRVSLSGRLLTYRRLVLPLFAVALSRQVLHARSLSGRGFFQAVDHSSVPPLVKADAVWGLLFVAVLIIGHFVTLEWILPK